MFFLTLWVFFKNNAAMSSHTNNTVTMAMCMCMQMGPMVRVEIR